MMSFGAFGGFGGAASTSTQGPSTNNNSNTLNSLNNSIFTPATAPPIQLNATTPPQPIDPNSHPFERLRAAYDPNSPSCPFRSFFYNRLPVNTVVNDVIKPPQVSDKLWQQVIDDNPRPGCFVPVMATGFQDLSERAKWQEACLTAHTAKIAELEQRLEKMLRGHESNSNNTSIFKRLSTAIQRQNQLALRIIKIMRQIEVLRRAGRRLSENEQEMLKLLQLLSKRLAAPPIDGTSVRVFAFQLKALADEPQACQASGPQPISDRFTTSIIPLLNEQQAVLSDLVECVNASLVDYDIMIHGYQL